MLADISSIYLLTNGNLPAPVRVLGAGGLVLAAPALHLGNGNTTGAIASLAVRGGLTALVLGIVSSQPSPCQHDDPVCAGGQVADTFVDAGLALGLLLGGVIFAVVDDTVLAKVSVEAPPAPGLPPARGPATTRGSDALFSAFVAPRPGGLSFGVGATF